VNPDLQARASNKLVDYAKQTTSDADIIRRAWLPIDLDPVRVSGVSSTDLEHEAALELAGTIRTDLKENGWPDPFLCDSGNGAHLLYHIDLPNDDGSRDLVQKVLKALDLRYSNEKVQVDTTTYNAARIWKLYGTKACKGDSTEERPHRMAKILDVPNERKTLDIKLLNELASQAPVATVSAKKEGRSSKFDIDSWIKTHDLNVALKDRWQNKADKYILETCPWNENHTNRSAYIITLTMAG
jgi:hypothetical protein